MTGSLFGPTSTPTLGGGSIFGSQMQSPGLFGTPTQQQQQPQQQMITAQPLGEDHFLTLCSLCTQDMFYSPCGNNFSGVDGRAGVAVSPYGVLPQAPNVGTPIPEYKGGISARPVSALGPPRPTAVMASRPLTPRSGIRLRPSRARSVSRCVIRLVLIKISKNYFACTPLRAANASSGALHGDLPGLSITALQQGLVACRGPSSSPADFLSEEADTGANGSAYPSIFLARDNPRQFFVREPLPSTAASTTPSSAAAGPPALRASPGPSAPLPFRKPAPERSNSAGVQPAFLLLIPGNGAQVYICPNIVDPNGRDASPPNGRWLESVVDARCRVLIVHKRSAFIPSVDEFLKFVDDGCPHLSSRLRTMDARRLPCVYGRLCADTGTMFLQRVQTGGMRSSSEELGPKRMMTIKPAHHRTGACTTGPISLMTR